MMLFTDIALYLTYCSHMAMVHEVHEDVNNSDLTTCLHVCTCNHNGNRGTCAPPKLPVLKNKGVVGGQESCPEEVTQTMLDP